MRAKLVNGTLVPDVGVSGDPYLEQLRALAIEYRARAGKGRGPKQQLALQLAKGYERDLARAENPRANRKPGPKPRLNRLADR